MNDLGLLNLAFEAALVAGKKTLQYFLGEFDVLVKQDNSPLTLADLESNKIINQYLEKTGLPILSEENRIMSYGERKKWKRFWLVDPLDGTKEFIKKSAEFSVNIALIEHGNPILGVVYMPALNIVYYGSKKTGSFKANLKKNSAEYNLEKIEKTLLKPGEAMPNPFCIVASKSHMAEKTARFIEKVKKHIPQSELRSYGSSLKLCMVAEGSAGLYPRFGPTMEWDIAASHAVVEFAGCKICQYPNLQPMIYNKEDLHNPPFIVYIPQVDNIIKNVID